MNYIELCDAHTEHPVATSIAVTKVLERGQWSLNANPATVASVHSAGFSDDLCERVAAFMNHIATMDTKELIVFVQRDMRRAQVDSIPPTSQTGDRDGICPLYGGELEYEGDQHIVDDGTLVSWTCKQCGATGKSGYDLSFDQHYNVCDAESHGVPGRED